ncbi:MAG: methionine gamma-lyase family protein [Clostridia bacterium]|nr:methionine gamma-lyase family protein [Clostridia bacterium]
MEGLRRFFDIDENLLALAKQAEQSLEDTFAKIDEMAAYNEQNVLSAFIKAGISSSHFNTSTGYGYDDRGRDTLDAVAADIFGCEDAIMRYNFVCGTHALTVPLFGMLRPGDTMLSVTGTPYDTLRGVIGIGGECDGSLHEFGINYKEVALREDGSVDIDAIPAAITDDVKMVYIQRSRGYSLRPSLFVEDIEAIAKVAKSVRRDVIVMVDNCYGEFVQYDEPCARGADIMAGSLIKNPGGGIAPTGGYIAGRHDLVEKCAYRLTTPGTGRELGCTLGHTRELYMGLINAPRVVGEAKKTAAFCAALFDLLGYGTLPSADAARADIIQTVLLRDRERLIEFCRGIQSGSAVDAFALPEPGAMPGYDCDIIMASGSFTLGSSIELSADAPLREPYAVFMQGGLSYASAKVGVLLAAKRVLELDKAQG